MGKVPNLTRVFPWEDSALARVNQPYAFYNGLKIRYTVEEHRCSIKLQHKADIKLLENANQQQNSQITEILRIK